MPRASRGNILLIAVGTLAIALLICMGLIALSGSSSRLATDRADQERALQLAEAGLRHGFASLCADNTYTGSTNTPFGDGTFSVAVTPNPAESHGVFITSTGTVGSRSAPVSRTVVATAEQTVDPPMWGYSIFSQQALSLNKNVIVDSGPIPHLGDIQVNSSISIDPGGYVDGTITAVGAIGQTGKGHHPPPPPHNPKGGGSGNNYTLNGVTVTGGSNLHAPPMPFPSLSEMAAEASAASLGTMSANSVPQHWPDPHTGTTVPTVVLKGVIQGSINIVGDVRIVIEGPVFVTGNCRLDGSSYTGSGGLFCGGQLHIEDGSNMSAFDAMQVAMVSFGKQGALLEDGATIGGGIYAPNGPITVEPDVKVFGSLAAQSFNFQGAAHITRNTDWTPPHIGNFASLSSWREE